MPDEEFNLVGSNVSACTSPYSLIALCPVCRRKVTEGSYFVAFTDECGNTLAVLTHGKISCCREMKAVPVLFSDLQQAVTAGEKTLASKVPSDAVSWGIFCDVSPALAQRN
jgi:hypothetical protein